MRREITQSLIDWKNRTNRSPLIVRGARQVGKTYIIEEFAKLHFKNSIKINLEEKPEFKKLFSDNDVKRIISELSVLTNTSVIPGDTLLFIDEIQACPDALAALRYFKENIPGLHVISAGSLLDHILNDINTPMPVGRIEFLHMYPLNFKEFLAALKQEKLIEYLEKFDFSTPFSELIHKKLTQLLRYYFFIGGMPEVVKSYVENDNLNDVRRIHSNILTSLHYDFAKYGTRKQQEYLQVMLRYCGRYPSVKIKYSNIDPDIRSTYLKDAAQKLELSRVIHIIAHSNSSSVPITGFIKKTKYKTAFLDIGFVNHLSQIDLINLNELMTAHEGMLAEQFVAQELLSSKEAYLSPELFFWLREEKSSNAEVDFLHQQNNKIYPVEVKAGKTGTLRSLQIYLKEKKLTQGIRLNMGLPTFGRFNSTVNFKNKQELLYWDLLSLPLYMTSELNRLIRLKLP